MIDEIVGIIAPTTNYPNTSSGSNQRVGNLVGFHNKYTLLKSMLAN